MHTEINPVRIVVRHCDGSQEDGFMLGMAGNVLRAAIPATEDAIELRYTGREWVGEDDIPVDVDFQPFSEEVDADAIRDEVTAWRVLAPALAHETARRGDRRGLWVN